MGSRQNTGNKQFATVRADQNVSNVLSKEAMQEMSDALATALTLNPQAGAWTAGIRTAMTNVKDDLDDLIALI